MKIGLLKESYLALILVWVCGSAMAGLSLEAGFERPPADARPQTWYHMMNGNVTKEGITCDFEALAKAGIGGVQMFDAGCDVPPGPLKFNTPEWYDMFRHAQREAKRLGLEICIPNCSGWSSSGGPWNMPSNGMKFVECTETPAKGPGRFSGRLPRIERDNGFYEDIAVLAYPTPAPGAAISDLPLKTFRDRDWRKKLQLDTDACAPNQAVAPRSVVNLTKLLRPDGGIEWDVPAGDWTILRIGYANNGRFNHPASEKGVGPEVDKLAGWAMEWHFDHYVAKLCKDLGISRHSDNRLGFNNILVDSYEVGGQNWTQGFERIFRERMGYDLTPYLPVLAGRIVGGKEESERFLEDYRRVIGDLFAENYSGKLAELCHRYGLRLSLEPYGNCPADNLDYGEAVDIPMGEYWSYASRGANRSGNTGNARYASYLAHVWGRRYAGTESFTSGPDGGGRWQTTPFVIKHQGDRVFAEGVNRIIYHRFTHQPWPGDKYLPGLTMGRWGMHLDRTQTWWKYAPAWFDYQSRCSWMLQEGQFVAEALFWCGEWMPNGGGDDYTGGASHFGPEKVGLGAGYHWDVCSTKALLALTVRNGKVVAPGGVEYPLLVLPKTDTMSEAALKKIAQLLAAGAKVSSETRPTRSAGLRGWPGADAKIAALAAKVWASGVMECSPSEALNRLGVAPDFLSDENDAERGAVYIHRCNATADWYFTALGNDVPHTFEASYRITGCSPELWDPVTGRRRPAPVWREENGRTIVRLSFPPSGSCFVVFRRKPAGKHVETAEATATDWDWTAPGRFVAWEPVTVTVRKSDGSSASATATPPAAEPVSGPWQVSFPPGWDAPADVTFPELKPWNEHEDKGIRYFSGTAIYHKHVPAETVRRILDASDRLMLDLGEVHEFAEVSVNGKRYPALWKPPFRLDVTESAKGAKGLDLEIKVTNLWPNRLIGDDFLPDDCVWRGERIGGINEISLAEFPEWVRKGEKSPTGRHTFTTWKHWTKDDPLLPSGLFGPVRLRGGQETELSEGQESGRIRRTLTVDGTRLKLDAPTALSVLKPAKFVLKPLEGGALPRTVSVRAEDGKGIAYQKLTVSPENGALTFTVIPGGHVGTHRIRIGSASVSVPMERVDTALAAADDPRVKAFFDDMKYIILKEIRHIPWQGTMYYENKEWLRDHIHILKATRYWKLTEKPPILDPRTPLELWIRLQFADGIYPEIVVAAADDHVHYTRPEYATPMEGGRMMIRLEAENDIEFLMAQAIWQAWNATGDDKWLTTPLPGALSPLASLDKALQHVVDDKVKRWDDRLGLSVRGVSCDTWDWVYGQKGKDANRRIEPDTAMAAFYGDNTGLYQAFRQLAEMQRRVARDEARAKVWEKRAAALKAALMKHAWNGRFFAHMVHTRPTVEEAPPEWREDFAADRTRLSLSNAYSLNRGIFTPKEASSVIEAFLDFRVNPPRAENADCPLAYEWVTLFPGYKNERAILYAPGRYANGALGSFTAGELMRGAYVYGYEGYGSDILKRLLELEERDGEIVFMYDQNGQVFEKKPDGYNKKELSMGGGGPAGWGTAAIYDAMVAGLAGVRDIDGQFDRLVFAPAWESLGCRSATSSVSFATVDDYFAYAYRHREEQKVLSFVLAGNKPTVVSASIPVPVGSVPSQVLVNGRKTPFRVRTTDDHMDFSALRRERETASRAYAEFEVRLRREATHLDRIAISYTNKGTGK